MPQALHDYAYGTVKAGVSAGDYKALTDDGGGFRSHMAQNAADFHSLLACTGSSSSMPRSCRR